MKELRLRSISTMDDANAFALEFIEDYIRRFARAPRSTHDAHRPLLAHEQLERLFRWQEERRVTHNLTLHYKRVLYLLEPSELARAAAGQRVLVSETEDGEVEIEFEGVALPAGAFEKDSRVSQGASAENKVLGHVLEDIRRRQQERDAQTLATKRMTLREEDLMRKAMGEPGLPTRRRPGHPTLREQALARIAAAASDGRQSRVVDGLSAEAVNRLHLARALESQA